jgi:hypothetical protein
LTPTVNDNLALIRSVFEELGYTWVEPSSSTTGQLAAGEHGLHKGLYWIWPEENFYFGKAATQHVTKRHQSHMMKLKADLPALYGPPVEKVQFGSAYPDGWREGVAKYLLENDIDMVPPMWVRLGPKLMAPANLDFVPIHKRSVDDIPCLVWDLDTWTAADIGRVEKAINRQLLSYCNTEAHIIRRKERKNKA